MHKLKSIFFYQFFYQFCINVIFEWYLPKIIVFLVRGSGAENSEKRRKQIEEKH